MEPTRVSHFELIRLIGRGGMGEVHEAQDLKLRRRVALKFLSAEFAADPAGLTRFEREALAAAELNHPHIATVYTFEKDGDRPFIAMELLAGPSLRERIERGALPVAEALAIARDVALALAYAHRRGTSHRDIKPENLMFDEHGEIKIMDFGLARAAVASKLTVTGTSLGTPAYMAPEALRGETGPPGDVFALGLCLYEMIAGRRAYPGDNAMAVMFAIANEEPAPIRELVPDVPEAVDGVIRAMLLKDSAQRMDAGTAARELSAMTGVAMPSVSGTVFGGTGDAPIASAATSSTIATDPMHPGASGTGAAVDLPKRRRRARVVNVSLALLAGVGVSLGVWWYNADAAKKRVEAESIQKQAVASERAGDLTRARTLYQEALKLNPKQAGALTGLAMMYQRDSLFTSADSLFRAVVASSDDAALKASAYYNLGSNDLATQAYPSAVQNLRRAFDLDSSYVEVYNNLGNALIENSQPADALLLLDRGIRRFPGVKFLYKNAGRAALDLGDAKRALGYLVRALQIDPIYADAQALRDRAVAMTGSAGSATVH